MTTDRIIDVPGNDLTMPPEPSWDYLAISSIHDLSRGYRCDGSSNCRTYAAFRIDYHDVGGEMVARRYCELHAAWRLRVRP